MSEYHKEATDEEKEYNLHYTESEMANDLMDTVIASDWMVEVPYNNYGQRGVVDLLGTARSTSLVIELKSNYAVSESTGANEILRQFNKMKDNFFQGSEVQSEDYEEYWLIFSATRENIKHLYENRNMYGTLADDENACSIYIYDGGMAMPLSVVNSKHNIFKGTCDAPFDTFAKYCWNRGLPRDLHFTIESLDEKIEFENQDTISLGQYIED